MDIQSISGLAKHVLGFSNFVISLQRHHLSSVSISYTLCNMRILNDLMHLGSFFSSTNSK